MIVHLMAFLTIFVNTSWASLFQIVWDADMIQKSSSKVQKQYSHFTLSVIFCL